MKPCANTVAAISNVETCVLMKCSYAGNKLTHSTYMFTDVVTVQEDVVVAGVDPDADQDLGHMTEDHVTDVQGQAL